MNWRRDRPVPTKNSLHLSRIAPATTCATPSTPARSNANSVGRPRKASPAACARPCAGTWITSTGAAACRMAAINANAWELLNERGARDEGHNSRRRLGQPSAPDHPGGVETAAADLRQTDDLLPDLGADARRHPRDSDYLHARGPAQLPEDARRPQPVRRALRLRGTAGTGRPGPGLSDRRVVHRQRPRVPDPRRQYLSRPALHRETPARRRDRK